MDETYQEQSYRLDNRATAFIHDLLMIPLAWLGSYWLRFNLESVPPEILEQGLSVLPWVMGIQVACFCFFGLYRGVWRFASLPDLARIIKAVLVACSLIVMFFFFLNRFNHVPRSVLPLYGLLLISLLGGARFSFRWLKDKRKIMAFGKRVLIVGAGSAGESLVRDLLRDRKQSFFPVAFVDDAEETFGRDVHGLRVVAKIEAIPRIVDRYDIELIMLALPFASSEEMRRILALCSSTKCSVRTLPAVQDLVAGKVTLRSLRDVKLEDLLGREPVVLDQALLITLIYNQRIMVTGGGGSIGAELCRQLLRMHPKELIVVDHSEYNLFELEQELQQRTTLSSPTHIQYQLVDIRCEAQISRVLEESRPSLVLHAAAYKHVNLLEPQIRAALLNNVLGTSILARAVIKSQVKKFVLVSTDKAVDPGNIMGATKRCAEIFCQAYGQAGTTEFMTVRFGNVLGSRGSVVEIFRKQLEKGGPLTVTDPAATRYFMTIPEAAQLILQAAALGQGQGGEVFVLDMGEPVNISYLAEQMIRLAGKRVDKDIAIDYIGLRAGEKLEESLFYASERLEATQHPKISKTILKLHNKISLLDLHLELETLLGSADESHLQTWLQKMVPEFKISTETLLKEYIYMETEA